MVYFVKNGIYGEDIDLEKSKKDIIGTVSYIENKIVKKESPYLITDNNKIGEIVKHIKTNIDSVAYLEYEIEKKLKKDSVISSFKKIGKVKEEDLEYHTILGLEVLGDEKNRYNYRNKVSLKVKVCKDEDNMQTAIFRILQKEK
jgi:hypothetical protein